MFSKFNLIALTCITIKCAPCAGIQLQEPDHIAIALAESLSMSASHLVQLAAESEVAVEAEVPETESADSVELPF